MITPSHNDLRPDLDAIEAAAFPPDGDAPANPPSPDDVRALIDYIRHLESREEGSAPVPTAAFGAASLLGRCLRNPENLLGDTMLRADVIRFLGPAAVKAWAKAPVAPSGEGRP